MKYHLSIIFLWCVLSTNLVACEKEAPKIAPTGEESTLPPPSDSDEDDDNTPNLTDSMPRLRIVIGGRTMTATLYDNPTARDFVSRLPLTVDMSDFAGTEKIFTPSPGLATKGTSHGCHPKAGDIATYAPWRNIAIYYHDGDSFSNDMIPVGRIEGDISALKTTGSLRNVRFELIKDNTLKSKTL